MELGLHRFEILVPAGLVASAAAGVVCGVVWLAAAGGLSGAEKGDHGDRRFASACITSTPFGRSGSSALFVLTFLLILLGLGPTGPFANFLVFFIGQHCRCYTLKHTQYVASLQFIQHLAVA